MERRGAREYLEDPSPSVLIQAEFTNGWAVEFSRGNIQPMLKGGMNRVGRMDIP